MPPLPSTRNRALGVGALVLVAGFGAAALGPFSEAPSTEREWAADQARQPAVERRGDRITLENVRDFRHRPEDGPEDGPDAGPAPHWRTMEIDLADVRRVWMVLAPFADRWRGLAHAFVSFEMADGRFLAVSVEARRERDEPYSLVAGVSRRLELTYVVGTEADLIGLRAHRGDTLYVYPTRADARQSRDLLVDMLERAEGLRHEPEFYNTLTNNCVTNLRDHVNRVVEDALPWGWGVLAPGFSDEMALEQGLLDTDLPIDRARERFRVDSLARGALTDPTGRADFSRRIRGNLGGDDP